MPGAYKEEWDAAPETDDSHRRSRKASTYHQIEPDTQSDSDISYSRRARKVKPRRHKAEPDIDTESDGRSNRRSGKAKTIRYKKESYSDTGSDEPSNRHSRRGGGRRQKEESDADTDVESISPANSPTDSSPEDEDGSKADGESDIREALRLSKLDARKPRQHNDFIDDEDQVRRALDISRRDKRARSHNTSDDDEDLRKALAISEQVSYSPREASDEEDALQRIMEQSAKEHEALQQQQEQGKDQAKMEKEILKESKRLAKENEIAQKEKAKARRKEYKKELELIAADNKQEYDVKERQRKAWNKRQKVLAKEREEEAKAQRRAERQQRQANARAGRACDDEDPELMAQIRAAEAMSLGDVPAEGNSDEGLPPEDCPPAFGDFTNDGRKRPRATKYTTSTRTERKSGHLVEITPEIKAEMDRYFVRMAVDAAEELLDKKDKPPEYDDIFPKKGKAPAKSSSRRWDMATAIAGGGLEDVRQAAATYQRRADHAYGPQRTQAQRLGAEPARSNHPSPWQNPFARVLNREDSQRRPRDMR